jgi:hypothetical protein
MLFRFIQWLWGQPLGKFVEYRSFSLGFDDGGCPYDWQEWGITWVTMVCDEPSGRRTSTPIWN